MKARKKKQIKRISVLAALVTLVCLALSFSAFATDSSGVRGTECYTHGDVNSDGEVTVKDAVHLLYYTLTPDNYSVNQNCDFNGDGEINTADAIRLLYSANGLFSDLFNLDGVIHAYDTPSWKWEITEDGSVAATAVYSCACGEHKNQSVAATVTAVEECVQAATCTTKGSAKYTAKAEFSGVQYETEYTMTSACLGHIADSTDPCAEWKCTACGEVLKVAGHSYVTTITEATCTKRALYTYNCEYCEDDVEGATYSEYVGSAKGHQLEVSENRAVEGKDCTYVTVYVCSACEAEVPGEEQVLHSYTSAITTEATCSTAGEKKYTCSECSEFYTEEILMNSSHTWDEGTTEGGITTYTCTACSATRTSVVAKEGATSVEVTSEALSSAGAVDVNGATVELDADTVTQLTAEEATVEISVTPADTTAIDNYEEIAAQIGNSKVYDFSVLVNNSEVTEFVGNITISLPYELQDDDDVDSIDVWYIQDDGSVEVVQGTYSNGFVTFTTDHFSYYAVTKLTPAERCKEYGHNETENIVAATCESNGYTLYVCARCAETWQTDVVECAGHALQETNDKTSCEAAWSKTETCTNEGCGYSHTTNYPASGHEWVVVEDSVVEATCTTAGSASYTCSNCESTRTETTAQLEHTFATTETVTATCESKGSETGVCSACGYKELISETAALGHDYTETWKWAEDGLTATVTLVCNREDCDSEVKLDASISISKYVAASCSKEGSTTYTATVAYNQKTFTDSCTVVEEQYTHTSDGTWASNSAKHYQLCTLCGERMNESVHAYDDGMVTVEPTCTEDGNVTFTCECGYIKEEAVPAVGHDLVDGACTKCDFTTETCTHEEMTWMADLFGEGFDGEEPVCGFIFEYSVCECGERKVYNNYGEYCKFEEVKEYVTDSNGYVEKVTTSTCTVCGMVKKETFRYEVQEDDCVGTQHLAVEYYTADGELIYENETIFTMGWGEFIKHPGAVYVGTVDMTTYGLCGGTVVQYKCPCGEYERIDSNLWDECEWNYVESDDNYNLRYCSECGVYWKTEYVYTDENCLSLTTYKHTFMKDDVELVSFNGIDTYISHDYTYAFTFDVENGTCADGYTVTATCTGCGDVDTWHEQPDEYHHYTYFKERIELSEETTCGGYINVSECPCGEEQYFHRYNVNCSLSSSWNYEDTDNGYIETTTYTCEDDCGFKFVRVNEYQTTDLLCTENCFQTNTVYVGNEVILTGSSSSYNYSHTSEYEVIVDSEMLGATCEDGVKATVECTECGDSYETVFYHHRTFVQETYSTADYGMCDGTITIYGCVCGENSWIESDTECAWNYYNHDSETNTDMYKCVNCKMTRYNSYTAERLEGCQIREADTYEFLKGYNVVLSIEAERLSTSHSYERTFELKGEVCSDGYTVYETCTECGESQSYTEQPSEGEHWTYNVGSYNLADYGFCGGNIYIYSCPCGEEQHYGAELWEYCDWSWDGTTNMYTCLTCGGTYTRTTNSRENDECTVTESVTFVFCPKNAEELVIDVTNKYQSHKYVYSFEVSGSTCSDGYYVNETCVNCGETSRWYSQPDEGDHWTYRVEYYDLAEYGLCGSAAAGRYACACGKEENSYFDTESCDWQYVESNEETGEEWYQCSTCKNYLVYGSRATTTDGCKQTYVRPYTLYNSDKEQTFTFNYTNVYESHNYEYTFELEGTSCTDGFYGYATCTVCGDGRSWYSADEHPTYATGKYDLTEYGFCSGTISHNACPCGEYNNYYFNELCGDFSEAYDEETSMWTYRCSATGAYWTEAYSREAIDDCYYYRVITYTFYDKNGVEFLTFDTKDRYESHTYVYSFNLYGESCSDGYDVTVSCENCSYGYTEYRQPVEGEHWTYCVETVDLAAKGLCAGSETRRYACPCEEKSYWNTDIYCNFENYQHIEDNHYRHTCSECGSIEEITSVYTTISECETQEDRNIKYIKDDEVVFEYDQQYINEHHEYVWELSLNDGATDCYDGWTGYGVCQTCGAGANTNGWGHSTYALERVDFEEHGFCGGYYEAYSCACGQEQGEWASEWYCSWNWTTTDSDGYEVYVCNTCGATKKVLRELTYIDECNYTEAVESVFISPEGEEVAYYEYTAEGETHEYKITSATLNGTSCDEGCVLNRQCLKCGYTDTVNSWGHSIYLVEEYQFVDYGACDGGYLRYYSCACGEEGHVNNYMQDGCDDVTTTSNTYTDEDGTEHEVLVRVCNDCGLRISYDQVCTRNADTCKVDIERTYVITVGDTAVDTFVMKDTNEAHAYTKTVSLVDGATSCVEGVNVTQTCVDCGEIYQYTDFYHDMVEVERVDLSEYGSTCGGYVVVSECACGQSNDLEYADWECDVSSTYLEDSNYGDEELSGQNTSEGWRHHSNYGYIHKCAVTDPECSFVICENYYPVWDKENCMVTYYETWQLGYDETTGACDRELTIARYSYAYHDYDETVVTTETNDDGTYTETNTATCPRCGSYTVEIYTYDENGILLKSDREYVNMSSETNGEAQKRYYITEYVYYEGEQYLNSYKSGYVNADGVETWDNNEYVYDWDNFDCTYTRTYTNSSGESYTYVENCHKMQYEYDEYYYDRTCSQHGYEYYICSVCDHVEDEDVYEPYDHSWSWDDTEEVYVCTECGLESANGSSGSVVFEDLTADYGNDENYVIGYYAYNDVQFTYYVSLVNPDNADDEVLLSGITFTELDRKEDGIQAIAFSMEEVNEALAEYEGYYVRFTFVPVGADGDYDYSITLTE